MAELRYIGKPAQRVDALDLRREHPVGTGFDPELRLAARGEAAGIRLEDGH